MFYCPTMAMLLHAYESTEHPQSTSPQEIQLFSSSQHRSTGVVFLKDKHNNNTNIPSLPEFHNTILLDYAKINILKPTNQLN
eukprot:10785761-Ditylum_brightwellii.AAC.1